MTIERITSGGQSGADLAALIAARRAGIPTGGFAARGWLFEVVYPDGIVHVAAPFLADFGLVECPEPGYKARRQANVRACDAALLFGDATTPGSRGLLTDCRHLGKPPVWVKPGVTTPGMIVRFLEEAPYVKTLMVAGNRESKAPGIGRRVEAFLGRVFAMLAREEGR